MNSNSVHREYEKFQSSKTIFGFWIYIMTDAVMMATVLVCYVVLKNNIVNGPSIKQVVIFPHILLQTLLMLGAAFTINMGMLKNNTYKQINFWLFLSLIANIYFAYIAEHDLISLYSSGDTWRISGFLTAYYSLIDIFIVHVVVVVLWIIILMAQFRIVGKTSVMSTRLNCLSLFGNFLNIIWFIILSVVYLIGVL